MIHITYNKSAWLISSYVLKLLSQLYTPVTDTFWNFIFLRINVKPSKKLLSNKVLKESCSKNLLWFRGSCLKRGKLEPSNMGISNSRLYWWLETNKIVDITQSRFRARQRTEDLLFRITQGIIDGLHHKKRMVAVFVDFKQVYEMVWRKGQPTKMQACGFHGILYNWIKNFLNERLIQTKVIKKCTFLQEDTWRFTSRFIT